MRSFTDHNVTRSAVFDAVLNGLTTAYPIENTRYRLDLLDPAYKQTPRFSIKDQKQAILNGSTLSWPVHGTWRLTDVVSGAVVDESKKKVADVPWMTPRGTFIYNGNEYTVGNQSRLKPGVYTRVKASGDVESHFNAIPGGGTSFHVTMEPKSGILKLRVANANILLYPLLKSMGVTDKQLEKAWGSEVLAENRKDDRNAVDEAIAKLGRFRNKLGNGVQPDMDLTTILSKTELDPDVTKITLGKPYRNVTPETILDATKRVLGVMQNRDKPDDRDHMAFQKLYSAEDFFGERITKDAGGLGRKALWRATLKNGVRDLDTGVLSKQLASVLISSGLGQTPEEINVLELLDHDLRVSRLGEGGIRSIDSIPDESRMVHTSQFGFIDPIRGPESSRIGVDTRLALDTWKEGNKILSSMTNVKTGKKEKLTPEEVLTAVVAFPGEMRRKSKTARVVRGGEIDYVPKSEVDYELPNTSGMFTASTNLVPMHSGVSGLRVLMAGKFFNQALALKEGEAPLVQSATPDDPSVSFEDVYGKQLGTVQSDAAGTVASVDRDSIKVRAPSGDIKEYELYDNFPFNRKSYLSSTPIVAAGQRVVPGQVLAGSNYTNKEGTLALGKNLRVAFVPYRGYNYEDAIVISETAAKKLMSEHMTKHSVNADEGSEVDKKKYISLFPSVFDKRQMDAIDDNGVVVPGTIVQKGDPLILASAQRQETGRLHKLYSRSYLDKSMTWNHDYPGLITDVMSDKGRSIALAKAYIPMNESDKLSNRYGNKGVVSMIVPDSKMPQAEDGKPLDVLLNPLGIVTRTNPSQVVEAVLGKIAKARGKPYKVPGFIDGSWIDFAQDELKKQGLKDTEDLFDPETGRKLKNILTGNMFFMKLHHTAESKISGRDTDYYTSEMIPARGGETGSKRLGVMELNALLSHGATSVLRDAHLVRGQRNDDYWRAFRLGMTPPLPPVPFIYNKFIAYMKGAGINVNRKGNFLNVMALTDDDIGKLTKGEITKRDTLNYKTMKPVSGGLFDMAVTGGTAGKGWGHITLAEPVPNPVMEGVIKSVLEMDTKKFDKVVSGEKDLNGKKGGTAISCALDRLNVGQEIARAEEDVKVGSVNKKNKAIKRLKYLKMFEKTGIKPGQLVWTRVPVVPPMFRPITPFKGMQLVSDANLLYQDLILANNNLKDIRDVVTPDFAITERKNLYDSVRAVVGLGDPVSKKHQQKQITGLIQHVLGHRPKFGMIQFKMLGTAVDVVGRAAITPNPRLDMDQVGLPEDKAWTLYRPFILRQLVRNGVPAMRAMSMIEEKQPMAEEALRKEMSRRPVIINRAPTLHKFGLMAAFPVLTKAKTLQISPIVTGGFGADFDGDTMQFHVPVTEESRQEAIDKMLPSRNLLSTSDFDVHYVPKNEFLLGLYQASSGKIKGAVKRFMSKQDVLDAFDRGEVSVDQPIEVLQ